MPIEVVLQPGEYCLVAITNNLTKFFTRNMVSEYNLTDSNNATVYSQRSDSEMGFNHEHLYRILPYSRVSKDGYNAVELYRTEYILAINNNGNLNEIFSIYYTNAKWIKAAGSFLLFLVACLYM